MLIWYWFCFPRATLEFHKSPKGRRTLGTDFSYLFGALICSGSACSNLKTAEDLWEQQYFARNEEWSRMELNNNILQEMKNGIVAILITSDII